MRTRSIDPNAKQSNGEMGWGNLNRMDPPLAAALKDIRKGQTSGKPYQSRWAGMCSRWKTFVTPSFRRWMRPSRKSAANCKKKP